MRTRLPRRVTDFRCHYRTQINAQPGGIEVDPEERIMQAFVNTEINGTPCDVWHGRRFWFCLPDPMSTSVRELAELMRNLKPLAQRICDGYESEWNGNNFVGRLNADAQAAYDEMQQRVEYYYPYR